MAESLTNDEFIRKYFPIIDDTLKQEFPIAEPEAICEVLRRSLLVGLYVSRKARQQRFQVQALIRRIAREQMHIYRIQKGNHREQEISCNAILMQNKLHVSRYLSRFTFRLSDTIDEVIAKAFEDVFQHIQKDKPIETLLSAFLISVAHRKALHELRSERSNTPEGERVQWIPFDTLFVEVQDDEIGIATLPIAPVDDSDQVYYPLGVIGPAIPMAQLREWIAHCLSQLSPERRMLIQLKHKYLLDSDLENLSVEQVETLFDDVDMAEIARRAGYRDAHTASVRLNESHRMLRKCVEEKSRRQSSPY